MPHIDSVEFGSIVVDGKKYHQVLIVGSETFERDSEKLESLFGTTHKIGDWEIEKLLEAVDDRGPEIIVVGTGFSGALEIQDSLLDSAVKNGVGVMVAQTPKAAEFYNQTIKAGKKVNALIHTTC
jgi:hypothetical protein